MNGNLSKCQNSWKMEICHNKMTFRLDINYNIPGKAKKKKVCLMNPHVCGLTFTPQP